MMLKRLHILVLKNYLGPFILTFFIAEFVLIMQFIWKYIDDLAGKGLEPIIIAEFILYLSASIVPMALPLAILLSGIMTFGALAENLELVACKAAGISLYRVMSPLIVVSVLQGFMAFYFSNNVLPVANLKLRSLLVDIQKQRPAIDIKPGMFYEGIKDLVIRVESVSKDKKTLTGIMIYDHSRHDNGNARVTLARSANIEVTADQNYLVLSLNDGVSYDEMGFFGRPDPKLPFVKNYFKKQVIPVDLSAFKLSRNSEDLYKDHYQMMTLRQLEKAIADFRLQFANRTADFGRAVKQNYFFGRSTPKPAGMEAMPPGFNPFGPPDPAALKANTNTVLQTEENIRRTPLGAKELSTRNFFEDTDSLTALQLLEQGRSIAQNGKYRSSDFLIEKRSRSESIARYVLEWHRKFTLSVACVVLFFVGAPLGAIIKRGGLGLPMVFSIVIFILYYVISTIGEKAAKQLTITPFWGMWISTLILIPIGIFLTVKAANDSKIFDKDSYIRLINKIFKRRTA
jgi:lipopolysaccharide export system permease protein